MSVYTPSADRFLYALTGQVVAALSNLQCRLHTAFPALTGNQLSGNGYGAVDLAAADFSRMTSGNFRRLSLPAMEWFANAASQAQTAEAISLFYGSDVAWDGEHQIIPQNARVFANAADIYIGIELADSTVTVVQAAMDRGLRAVAGEAFAAEDMFWELHSGSGTPTSANRLTGGGIDGIIDAAWTISTVSGFRRFAQAALTFSNGLTADTNAEPTRLALWRGRPENSGVLHLFRPISPTMMTEDGASITIAANMLYLELALAAD